MPTWLTSKLIGYALVALLASGLLWKAYDIVADYFNEAKNTRIELANERILRERADTELAVLRNTISLDDEHEKNLEILREEYQEKIVQTRVEAEAQIAVLEDRERLRKVTEGKPKLVEKLANNATRERFDELETIINN